MLILQSILQSSRAPFCTNCVLRFVVLSCKNIIKNSFILKSITKTTKCNLTSAQIVLVYQRTQSSFVAVFLVSRID